MIQIAPSPSPRERVDDWHPSPARSWTYDTVIAVGCYLITSSVVFLGAAFGHCFFRLADTPLAVREDLIAALANWDGRWYQSILEEGYQYETGLSSNVAFFPTFPVLGSIIAEIGVRADLALVLVANASLVAAFVVLAAYLKQRGNTRARRAGEGWDRPLACASDLGSGALAAAPIYRDIPSYVLLAFGLLPVTFFWRMAYSESLFLFLVILSLYSMERRWPLIAIVLVIGLATATRPVGVALLAPLLLHLREVSAGAGQFARRLWLAPAACWGLLAFCGYLYWRFDEPLAFVSTQEHWRLRGLVALPTEVLQLLALDPIVANFNPSCPCYWQYAAGEINPFFSLSVANPLYWLGAVGLVALGAAKSWLSPKEVALAFGLVFIPYVLKGHDTCLQSMGRYVSVAFPVYLVVGQLLARLGRPVALGILGIAGFFLGAYAALFAAWYRFF